MRSIPQEMFDIWATGDFTGGNRPCFRATIQHVDFAFDNFEFAPRVHLTGNEDLDLQALHDHAVGNDRKLQNYASLIFGPGAALPIELPNCKSLAWQRGVDSDVATGTLTLYNIKPADSKVNHLLPEGVIDLPGYYSPGYGQQPNSAQFRQQPNEFANLLVPDNIIRTFEGYGFDSNVAPERDPHLVQTGVWLISNVAMGTDGLMTITLADLGRVLSDQLIFTPVIPDAFYPLVFGQDDTQAGVVGPKIYTYTVDEAGNHDPKVTPPSVWPSAYFAPPTHVQIETAGDRSISVLFTRPDTPDLAPTDNQAAYTALYNAVQAAKADFATPADQATTSARETALQAAIDAYNSFTPVAAKGYKVIGYQLRLDGVRLPEIYNIGPQIITLFDEDFESTSDALPTGDSGATPTSGDPDAPTAWRYEADPIFAYTTPTHIFSGDTIIPYVLPGTVVVDQRLRWDFVEQPTYQQGQFQNYGPSVGPSLGHGPLHFSVDVRLDMANANTHDFPGYTGTFDAATVEFSGVIQDGHFPAHQGVYHVGDSVTHTLTNETWVTIPFTVNGPWEISATLQSFKISITLPTHYGTLAGYVAALNISNFKVVSGPALFPLESYHGHDRLWVRDDAMAHLNGGRSTLRGAPNGQPLVTKTGSGPQNPAQGDVLHETVTRTAVIPLNGVRDFSEVIEMSFGVRFDAIDDYLADVPPQPLLSGHFDSVAVTCTYTDNHLPTPHTQTVTVPIPNTVDGVWQKVIAPLPTTAGGFDPTQIVSLTIDSTEVMAYHANRGIRSAMRIDSFIAKEGDGRIHVPRRELINGVVYNVEVVAIWQEDLTPLGEIAFDTNVVREEVSDPSAPVLARPHDSRMCDIVPLSIVPNFDADGNLHQGYITFEHTALTCDTTFHLLAYRGGNPPTERFGFTLFVPNDGTDTATKRSFVTGRDYDLEVWNFAIWATSEDPSMYPAFPPVIIEGQLYPPLDPPEGHSDLHEFPFWHRPVPGHPPRETAPWSLQGTPDFTQVNGKGDSYFRSVGSAEFLMPPVDGAPAHDPGPAKTAPSLVSENVNVDERVTTQQTQDRTGQTTATKTPLTEAELTLSFADSSNTPYKNGDKLATEYGHKGTDALDDDPGTYWLSIGNERNDQGYSFEWWEGALGNVTLTHLRFLQKGIKNRIYVSVMASGKWVYHDPTDIIPYDPHNPLSHNGANIHYCEHVDSGPQLGTPEYGNGTTTITDEGRQHGEGPHQVVFKSPIPNATRVRLTWWNMDYFDEGPYHYRAALRKIKCFTEPGGQTTGGDPTLVPGEITTTDRGSVQIGVLNTKVPAPLVAGPPQDDDTQDTIKSFTKYIPATIVTGAGENPGYYNDYCMDEQSEALTQRGWLRWDEIQAGDLCLGMNPDTRLMEWQPVKDVYRKHRQRTMISMESQLHSSLTTPDHKWLVARQDGSTTWVTTETLKTGQRIPLAGPVAAPEAAKYEDAFVELVAWFWTEGWQSGASNACIAQSEVANPVHTARIRATLTALFGVPGRMMRGKGAMWNESRRADGVVTFRLSKPVKDALAEVAPDKVVDTGFLCALTTAQRTLFVERSLDADGWRTTEGRVGLAQRDERRAKAFEIACILDGRAVRTRQDWNGMWSVNLLRSQFTLPQNAKVIEVDYDGVVWCPTLEHHNFVARRNGTVYVTGNTDIVKLLCAWGGFFWPEGAKWTNSDGTTKEFPFGPGRYGLENVDPVLGGEGIGRVWGDFAQTGTSGPAAIPATQWDKQSLLDGINFIREIVGFIFYIDEDGAVVWRPRNTYSLGNWIGNQSAESGRTNFMVNITDDQTIMGLKANISSDNVREYVFVATVNGTIGATLQGFNPNPIGLRRVAGWTDQYFASTQECLIMAELIVLRQLETYRQDSITIPGLPLIQPDDQVRISERVTAENYVHYVKSISSSNDMSTGQWTYNLSTSWLGDNPDHKDPISGSPIWSFNKNNLSAVTKAFLDNLVRPASNPVPLVPPAGP